MRQIPAKGMDDMTLQEKLQQFKEGLLAELSDTDVAIMENATRALVQSGITRQAKQIGDQAPRGPAWGT